MTTIDKNGKIVSQVMINCADRKESDIFAALAKQIIHFKSVITTSMGLPAPLIEVWGAMPAELAVTETGTRRFIER